MSEIMDLLNEDMLSAIYEGPLEDAPWEGLLGLIRQRLDLISCSLHFRLPSLGQRDLNISDSDWDVRALEDLYEQNYNHLNPFDFQSMKPGTVYVWDDFITRETFLESEFYSGFCRPLGIEYALCMCIDEPSGLRMWLTIVRNSKQRKFQTQEKKQIQRLFPHLRRALKILAVMQHRKRELLVSQAAVEQMAIGTVVLDNRGNVISANNTAQSLAHRTGSFSLKDGKLRLNDACSQEQLLILIREILAHPESSTAEVLSLPNRGETMPGLLLRAFPADSKLKASRRPALIIYLTDPTAPQVAPQQLVAQLFGLTKAEAKLATLLADGLSPAKAAKIMHVTEDTARSYCKRIYAKTGLNRQAELVRLVLKSVASLAT